MEHGRDWSFSAGDINCGVRTVGVLIKNGRILLQRERNGDEYALPGGHIRLGETLESGLIREYKEETGADIAVRRLLWIEEVFWEHNGKMSHQLAFYFLIEEQESSEIFVTDKFAGHRDNSNVLIGWTDIEKINEIKVYPEFMKKEIKNINGTIKHFVSE